MIPSNATVKLVCWCLNNIYFRFINHNKSDILFMCGKYATSDWTMDSTEV